MKTFYSLVFILLLFSSSCNAVVCDNWIDTDTGLYSSQCAALYTGQTDSEYNSTMSMIGAVDGAIFLVLVLLIMIDIGRSYKV